MSNPKLKIEFNDKEDSWILDQNSRFVLTAANVNEIKEVVNNISTELSGLNLFSDIYKFTRFVVPSNLSEGCNYELQLEITSDENFTTITDANKINSARNSDLFYLFSNETWRVFTDLGKTTFNSGDAGKTFYVMTKNYIVNAGTYFGRYKWINKTTGTETAYFGFVLGAFDFNDNLINDAQTKIEYCEVIGDASVNEKESHSYQFKAHRKNGEIVNLTPSATFTVGESAAVISGNSITFGKTNIEYVDTVKAEVQFENRLLNAYLNVNVHPVKVERLDLDGINNFSYIYSNVSKPVKIDAYYSNGTTKDVTSNCVVSSSFKNWTYRSKNFTVTGNDDEIGTLEISYSDPDYPELEKSTLVKYMKLVPDEITSMTVSNLPESINYDSLSSTFAYSYTVNAVRRNSGAANITSTTIATLISTCEGVSISNGTMTVNPAGLKAGQNITIMFTNPETNLKVFKTVNIYGSTLEDLIVKFNNSTSMLETFENTSGIPFTVLAVTSQGQKTLTSGYEFRCISAPSKVTIENNTISIGAFDENEFVTFLVSYEYHGKIVEKYVPILVKAVTINKLTVVGDFAAGESTVKTYKVKADYNNGTTDIDITSDCKLKLAYGNPGIVTFNETGDPLRIQFGTISSTNANITFVVEETSTGKTKAFTVKISKNQQ